MKKAIKMVLRIIGLILFLIGIYIIFQATFIFYIDDGLTYDGLGILLNENGEHYFISNIFLYISVFLTFGIGSVLLSYTKNDSKK